MNKDKHVAVTKRETFKGKPRGNLKHGNIKLVEIPWDKSEKDLISSLTNVIIEGTKKVIRQKTIDVVNGNNPENEEKMEEGFHEKVLKIQTTPDL